MARNSRVAFPGFKHVWLVGLRGDYYVSQVAAGLVKYRGQTHKWLIHHFGGSDSDFERATSEAELASIFVGSIGNAELAERIRALNTPVLDLQYAVHDQAWATHRLDYRAVGRMAAEHLLAQNHRHLAFACNGVWRHEQEIYEGFAEAARKHAHTLALIDRHKLIMTFELPAERVLPQERMFHWFPEMPRPFAVFAYSDAMAALFAELAFFAGVSVPEELAILGFGNDEQNCSLAHPHLSSIVAPAEKLGFLMGEHADAILEGKPIPPLQTLAPSNIVVRRSTDLAAIEDPIIAKALALMRRDAIHRVQVGDISRQLPVSRRTFNDRFLNAVGRTPREELFRIRLELAKERLLKTNETVDAVSMYCGFADTESMVRYFKKSIGLTPTQFRKQAQL